MHGVYAKCVRSELLVGGLVVIAEWECGMRFHVRSEPLVEIFEGEQTEQTRRSAVAKAREQRSTRVCRVGRSTPNHDICQAFSIEA